MHITSCLHSSVPRSWSGRWFELFKPLHFIAELVNLNGGAFPQVDTLRCGEPALLEVKQPFYYVAFHLIPRSPVMTAPLEFPQGTLLAPPHPQLDGSHSCRSAGI